MSLKVGRVTLTDPLGRQPTGRNEMSEESDLNGLSGPSGRTVYVDSWKLEGKESGASATTTLRALSKERKRLGSKYVVDDDANGLVEGYYELANWGGSHPGGGPFSRPWEFDLIESPWPWVTRQAEDDKVTGTNTADVDAEEELKLVYTPTSSEVKVLDPRNVAGAEKLNLPKGDWKIVARVWMVTTFTAKLRAKTTKLDGTVITSGAQVLATAAGAWQELDLGTFTISATDHKANWYEVHVQDPTNTNNVWIDRIRIVPA